MIEDFTGVNDRIAECPVVAQTFAVSNVGKIAGNSQINFIHLRKHPLLECPRLPQEGQGNIDTKPLKATTMLSLSSFAIIVKLVAITFNIYRKLGKIHSLAFRKSSNKCSSSVSPIYKVRIPQLITYLVSKQSLLEITSEKEIQNIIT